MSAQRPTTRCCSSRCHATAQRTSTGTLPLPHRTPRCIAPPPPRPEKKNPNNSGHHRKAEREYVHGCSRRLQVLEQSITGNPLSIPRRLVPLAPGLQPRPAGPSRPIRVKPSEHRPQYVHPYILKSWGVGVRKVWPRGSVLLHTRMWANSNKHSCRL